MSFGLRYFGLKVNGVFTRDNAQWDSTKHSLAIRVTPNAELRKAVERVDVNIRELAVSGTMINSAIDVASGEENTKLTPECGVNLSGSRIRIQGDSTLGCRFIRH